MLSTRDPELKTYVTIHLPMVLSTFFESSQVAGQLKLTVSKRVHVYATYVQIHNMQKH